MTTRLPLIDRIKALFGDLFNGKNIALNRPWSYEVEILPSSTPRGNQKGPLFSAHAIKPGTTTAARMVYTRANLLCLMTVEHTRSNLG